MKFKQFITILFISFSAVLKAQTEFRPGYIILLNGDTIKGEIDSRKSTFMGKFCKFKNANDSIILYTPKDISAFRFVDSKYFIAKEFKGTKYFFEYLIKGQLSVYYMSDDIGDHFYLEKNGTELIELPYETGTKYSQDASGDNQLIFYETNKHIGILNYYTKDAPKLQSRINSIKVPELRSLIKLAEDYHNAVCDGEKCIIFEKNLPKVKISLMPIIGITKLGIDWTSSYGLHAYFWTPWVNENFYFRSGFVFSKKNDSPYTVKIFKIPFMFHYRYQSFKLQPFFEVGFEGLVLYETTWKVFLPKIAPAWSLGLNYKLSNSLSINAGYYYDYATGYKSQEDFLETKSKLMPFSQTISLGLKFDL